jgi:hypothetical protein
MSTTSASRPGSVTLVVVLTWISAILALIGGVLALVGGQVYLNELGWSAGEARIEGIIGIVLGLILALLASALGKGSKFARFLVTIVMLFRLVVGAFGVVALWGSTYVWTGVVSMVLALIVLWLLWNAKAGAFFARR